MHSAENIWLGSESLYNDMVVAITQLDAATIVQLRSQFDKEDDEDSNPVAYQVEDRVAIISVDGPILSKPSWISRYLKYPTYPEIVDRLYEAADDMRVRGVVMRYDTGGGAAKGIQAVTNLVRRFNNNVKQVVSIADSSALSAGYWMASSGAMVVATPDAELGSVGVVMVMTDMSEYFKKIGIKHTVMRSAEYKAVVNPIEGMTPKAKEVITAELNHWHGMFVREIALNRGLPEDTVASKIATGRVLYADDAVRMQMADKVMSLTDLVSRLNTQYSKGA